VFGDAKTDNFLVDRGNHLWVINFGGSYIEGWVDPEIKETGEGEGDNTGIENCVNALHDPVERIWDRDSDPSFGVSNPNRTYSNKKHKLMGSKSPISIRRCNVERTWRKSKTTAITEGLIPVIR